MKKQKEFEQIDLFRENDDNYKITKPLRIISFFSGIGFQELGIKSVFKDAESYKTCEWSIHSILGYDAIWYGEQDKSCYITDKQVLIDKLLNYGVSIDKSNPATIKQIQRLDLETLNRINYAINRCHNLVNIMNVKGGDLEVKDTDKFEYIMTYSFPCQ